MPLLTPLQLIAFLGGLLPALLWLAFWLFEDKTAPEPKRYIFLTFIAGMASVWVALFLEQQAVLYLQPDFNLLNNLPSYRHPAPLILTAWAVIEELCKLGAAYLALRAWVFDEPVDALIYMVTAALGFAAVENTFFIFKAVNESGFLQGVMIGDLRFVGATLLHTLSSATIGVALAFAFRKSVALRRLYLVAGVLLAIMLHLLFNFFILGQGGNTILVFSCIWVGIVVLLVMIERVKVLA